jgi:hypothetical protein
MESFRQKHLLRFDFRQLQGFSEMSGGRLRMIQARFELAEHGQCCEISADIRFSIVCSCFCFVG